MEEKFAARKSQKGDPWEREQLTYALCRSRCGEKFARGTRQVGAPTAVAGRVKTGTAGEALEGNCETRGSAVGATGAAS